MANEPERAHVRILSPLDRQRREALVARLEDSDAIMSAYFRDGDSDVLIVHYRPTRFRPPTLLDAVRQHGVEAELIDPLV